MTFVEFELEDSNTCQYDYVALFDGASSDDVNIGVFCNAAAIGSSHVTSGDIMFVRFKTDGSQTYAGFLATYQAVGGGKYISSLSNVFLEDENFTSFHPYLGYCYKSVTIGFSTPGAFL